MQIQVGTVLTAKSICDHECIFEAEILDRKGGFVTCKSQGITRRVKIRQDDEGEEYIFAMGQFSMAPIFRAGNTKKS